MRVGMKASTSPPLSAEHRESTNVSTREVFSFDPANFGQSPTTLEQHEETSPCIYRTSQPYMPLISVHQVQMMKVF